MNSTIRKLSTEEIRTYVDIVVNAYPGFMQSAPDFKERIYTNLVDLQQNEESIEFFGLFRDEKLLGGMRIHYYSMNLYGKSIEVGGIGLVAVDLLHKKEKVAKEMLQFFIHYFKDRGTSLVALYPFRPDFYKKMGFGFGVKMNQYNLAPSSFPNVVTKDGLMFLDESHKELVQECYNRYAEKTHGMMYKTNNEIKSMFKNPNNKLVGYMNDGKLEGYLLFTFKKLSETNFLENNLMIQEWICENPTALAKLNTFIHSQADQIQRVILNSQDDALPFLFDDPRNGSNHIIPSVYHETNTAGVGIMYRISDIDMFFKHHNHFNKVSCSFKLNVIDSFLAKEPISHVVNLVEGKLSNKGEPEFLVELDIANLSSLMMGSIDVNRLYQYGLLKIDNINYLETFAQIFENSKQPICMTAF
jgi:predicted acetyltransferase